MGTSVSEVPVASIFTAVEEHAERSTLSPPVAAVISVCQLFEKGAFCVTGSL
jgi:hypothetical protein